VNFGTANLTKLALDVSEFLAHAGDPRQQFCARHKLRHPILGFALEQTSILGSASIWVRQLCSMPTSAPLADELGAVAGVVGI